MKFNNILYAFAIFMALFTGCLKIDEALLEDQTIYTVGAEINTEETKTSVTDEGFFTWSQGDQVWIHTTGGGVTGTLSSGAGSANATFTHGSYVGEMTGKAVYPYNSGHSISGDVLTVNLPATYELGSLRDNTNALMYGVSQDNTLKFNHMAGVMRFNIKNVPAGANQFKITLDKKINGKFTADLTESHPSVTTETASSDSEKTITLNFDALTQTTDLRLCFPLPVGTYNSLELELNSATETLWSYSKNVTNTVNRRSLLLMPTVTLGGTIGGDIENGEVPGTTTDLSAESTANSYIVSQAGTYSISPVKGNSSESVGSVSSVEVLWESFGTSETPAVGSLISSVSYENGKIKFSTPSTYHEGNAVIAAKDANGTILWSWHIWLTDQPEGQVYYNNAGTMMDRNLGATSATPGDVGALGLMYQWGRKDPFLGSSSISSNTDAMSSIIWPSPVRSSSSVGTVDYITANPTTFIIADSPYDWHYSSRDNTLWESDKSIYDPCPSGWRVPDGGTDGVWAKALKLNGSSSGYSYDLNKEGINFSGHLGDDDVIWYPAPGYRVGSDGNIAQVGFYCYSLSNTPELGTSSVSAKAMMLDQTGYINPVSYTGKSNANPVRCIQENSQNNNESSEDVNLSAEGTANSYIVSQAGTYSISPVKGNSSESVGSVSSVEVLWESFGTSETPAVGSLISSVSYENGKIKFSTPSTYHEGNAVIAAKDANGTILWSWHIWLTDQPEGQVYYNNAGTMMDRNLGATSATPGDVGALGLMYQWGRKDPFLGSSSISSYVEAKSTITWPSYVTSNSSNGTINYSVQQPTTFIRYNDSNYDWQYPGSGSTDNTRWPTSDSAKSIYDPCPAGWRVPDGGSNGVWSNAVGSSSSFSGYPYDSTNEGMNFSGKFGSDQSIWYPASGYRYNHGGGLTLVADSGYYWSASPSRSRAYYLYFNLNDYVYPSRDKDRADGLAVRCVQVID